MTEKAAALFEDCSCNRLWSESNKDILEKADSIFDVFTRFLRHMDASKLSHSAITKFLLGDDLFALNRDYR